MGDLDDEGVIVQPGRRHAFAHVGDLTGGDVHDEHVLRMEREVDDPGSVRRPTPAAAAVPDRYELPVVSSVGVGNADRTGGLPEAWDEASGRYRGLRGGESVGISMTAESVLVKSEVARRQLDEERPTPAPKQPPGEGEVTPTPGEGRKPEPESELPRRFHGGVSLDPVRLSRDVAEIADAVVQHLASQPNAEVELSLEIQAKLPEGAPDDVVRTVTENAKTLKFREYGFERE
jgi:hypothetical protein